MAAQIPGFRWQPARTTHYQRGRTEKIRGGAQHYTAGVDSRAWLTSTSVPPVSSTFLVRKNATMDFRGWQLVAIGDTAWTTAFANPYTVSIEYEHREGQQIPDGDVAVLAQTWIDIARYVAEKGLGQVPLSRSGIRGHKEWVNNPGLICPDGIRMDELVARINRRLAEQGESEPEPVARYFPQTGHFLAHGFRDYWESRDNPAEDGYPISEEFDFETDGGRIVTAQYFERARYEYQPDIAGNVQGVVLGRLGAEAIAEVKERYPDAFARRSEPGSAEVPLVSLDSWIPVRDPNDVSADAIEAVCYLHGRTPAYGRDKVRAIAKAIVARSIEFGFRTSICAAQILHETGYFQYGGQVQPEQNNFAGLGATNDGAAGASFASVDEGVLAVMCHLALYVYGDVGQWPEHLRQYGDRAIRRDAVLWADRNTRKPDGSLLRYLGVVQMIKDWTNGRWAFTPSVPRGTLENGYARALTRIANTIIEQERGYRVA